MRINTSTILLFVVVSGLTLSVPIAEAQMRGGGMMGMDGMMGQGYGGGTMGQAYGRGGMMGPGYWGGGGYGGGYGGYGYPNMTENEQPKMDQETSEMVKQVDEQTQEMEKMLAAKKPDQDKVLAQQKKISELQAKLDEKEVRNLLQERSNDNIATNAANMPSGYYGYPGRGRWGNRGMYGSYGMGLGYGSDYMSRGYYQSYPQGSSEAADKQTELKMMLRQKQQEMTKLLSQDKLDRQALQEKNIEISRLQAELEVLSQK